MVSNPPVAEVVHGLDFQRCRSVSLCWPMYPQYSATTTASARPMSSFKALLKERRVPALRIVPPYYDHPAYLDALTRLILEEQARLSWVPDHFLLSFHGIPISYCQRGDIYATHVKRTTRALIPRLGWPKGQWTQTFQSLFGREEWLKPYTESHLAETGRAAAADVLRRALLKFYGRLPGNHPPRLPMKRVEAFHHEAAADMSHRCPCLNDHPAWITAMRDHRVYRRALWLEVRTQCDDSAAGISFSRGSWVEPRDPLIRRFCEPSAKRYTGHLNANLPITRGQSLRHRRASPLEIRDLRSRRSGVDAVLVDAAHAAVAEGHVATALGKSMRDRRRCGVACLVDVRTAGGAELDIAARTGPIEDGAARRVPGIAPGETLGEQNQVRRALLGKVGLQGRRRRLGAVAPEDTAIDTVAGKGPVRPRLWDPTKPPTPSAAGALVKV